MPGEIRAARLTPATAWATNQVLDQGTGGISVRQLPLSRDLAIHDRDKVALVQGIAPELAHGHDDVLVVKSFTLVAVGSPLDVRGHKKLDPERTPADGALRNALAAEEVAPQKGLLSP